MIRKVGIDTAVSFVATPKGRVMCDDDSCLHAFGRHWQHGDSETEG